MEVVYSAITVTSLQKVVFCGIIKESDDCA